MRVINMKPRRLGLIAGALAPFLVIAFIYGTMSNARLAENPNDKLLPGLVTMGEAVKRVAFEPDRRSGKYLFWNDTGASLKRLGLGVAIAASMGLLVGVLNGFVPWFSAFWTPFVRALSLIPPLAVLPILFIVFGIGELAKVVLIVVGIAPFLMRDVESRVRDLPREQLIKAQTLGASSWQIALRVVLPQVAPRLIDAVRLSLGSAWLFLIAAEAIASTEGLGYRIFLVRRYLSMDIILPYVVWIAFLAFAIDYGLRQLNRRAFRWYGGD